MVFEDDKPKGIGGLLDDAFRLSVCKLSIQLLLSNLNLANLEPFQRQLHLSG